MDDSNTALAIFVAIAAILGATGGLSGLAALYSAKNSARRQDVDALNATVKTLQAENARLVKRVDGLEEQLDEMRIKFSEAHHEATRLESENRFLREQVEELQNG